MSSQVYVLLIFGSLGFCHFLSQGDSQDGPLILTHYLESGQIEKAKRLSRVDPTEFADVNSYAGYFTVNKTNKWHLFFWYFPAEEVPLETTPLILWFQGGPGASSLYGLFTQIGPIAIKDGKVERRAITWGKEYSLLFIDNPVGTGFSFTENPNKYVTNEDMVGECLLNFLTQFLQVFTELRPAPLFLTGESYGGKYILVLGHYIHHMSSNAMRINLKGLAIGNGWLDPPTLQHYSEWAFQVGLVDAKQAAVIHQLEEDARQCWAEHDMTCFREKAEAAYATLKSFAPINDYNYVVNTLYDFRDPNLEFFLNNPKIQKLIHVKRMRYDTLSSVVEDHLYFTDYFYSVKPWLEELLEYYGVMCYSGQLDVIVAYALSVHTRQSLNWSGQQAYLNADRKPLFNKDNETVYSFVKASGNFMDVMVRGAGHMVPTDQPLAAKQIIDIFIQKFK